MHKAALQPHFMLVVFTCCVWLFVHFSISANVSKEQTWYHSTMTHKEIQRSNKDMHVSQINAWRHLCLHIFHSAWTGLLSQPLFNASCSIMHLLVPHVNWPLYAFLQLRPISCMYSLSVILYFNLLVYISLIRNLYLYNIKQKV